MKLRTLSPVTRSGLILLALGCVTLLAIVGLERSETSAVALSLFQSPPPSPVGTPAPPRAGATAVQPSPPLPTAAGSPILLWVIIGAVVVAVLLILGVLLFRRH